MSRGWGVCSQNRVFFLCAVLKAYNLDLKLPKVSWEKPKVKVERFLMEPELLSIFDYMKGEPKAIATFLHTQV